MLTNIVLVLIFLALVRVCQYLHVVCKNTAVAAVAQSKQHSEIVLLLRGSKSILAEIADKGKK